MEPAPAIHSARTLLTQNLRAKSARSRTEYKREKSAPCEQNKSGGEHVQEQTSKKEKKRNKAVSGKGPTTGVGKRPMAAHPSVLCVVSQL